VTRGWTRTQRRHVCGRFQTQRLPSAPGSLPPPRQLLSAHQATPLSPAPRQLAPSPQGYTLLALAQAHTSLPAGGWMLQLVSDAALPALQDAPVLRTASLTGSYAANTRLVVCR